MKLYGVSASEIGVDPSPPSCPVISAIGSGINSTTYIRYSCSVALPPTGSSPRKLTGSKSWNSSVRVGVIDTSGRQFGWISNDCYIFGLDFRSLDTPYHLPVHITWILPEYSRVAIKNFGLPISCL
jgi:hypothetical protein